MNTIDLYCLNCRQDVSPRRSFGPTTYLLAVVAFFAANPLLVLLVGLQLSGLWWLFLAICAAAAIFLWPGQRDLRAYCPICKSRSLSEAPAVS